ncbi:MAG: mannitol dehydrogenase family protein [Pseudomonadota bacterium]
MTARLSATQTLPPGVHRPAYDPAAHGPGIVHIGLGAFHKAHQAVYTDDALAAAGGDWRIIGISPRSATAAAELAPQDHRYTVIARDAAGSTARVIGAIASTLSLATNPQAVLKTLIAPTTRIVTLTVTERGYGIDLATGRADAEHPAIAADLLTPEAPTGVAGLLTLALRQRHAQGIPPFTVLSCDNLPQNGTLVRRLLIDFATHTAPTFAPVLADTVAVPATMVDRITPAPTVGTSALAKHHLGLSDHAAVETEVFRQWVVEDTFPQGRPAWEAGGAILTRNVAPYETMKLRMLNGAHSMLAYCGVLLGHPTVRDVMADPAMARLIARHLDAAARTLAPTPGLDLTDYARRLLTRFQNPNLAHQTRQIARDGSQKMPQRIFAPAEHAAAHGHPLAPFAFATAAWLRFTVGRTDDGHPHDLADPLISAPDTALPPQALPPHALIDRVASIIPTPLQENPAWREAVTTRLKTMLTDGMRAAVEAEAAA